MYDTENSRVVITASHGGTQKPGDIPDRPENGCYDSVNNECTYVSGCDGEEDIDKCEVKSEFSDFNTQHFAEELADRLKTKLGGIYFIMSNFGPNTHSSCYGIT